LIANPDSNDRPINPNITIASPQKNSDRPLNPKNHDRLSPKIKQRSPPQPQKSRSPQQKYHDRHVTKTNSDRPLNPKNHDRLNKKSNSDQEYLLCPIFYL
jgi:hypothetical protein